MTSVGVGGLACPVCGGVDLSVHRTRVGDRALCGTCFHGWRTCINTFDYAATAMCSLGTSDDRLRSQIAFFAPYAKPDARMLELGCATGELAAATRAALKPARYEAIELSPAGEQARSYLDRLHGQPLGELIDAGAVAEPFDLILLSHVLEHLDDPAAEVAAMRQVLAPDGAIFIEVPNRSGHRGLPFDDNRSHLHFFSASSLTRLLAQAGLETVAIANDAWLDARYADSLRVVVRPHRALADSRGLLSDHPALAGRDKVVVWGAGSLSDELLANFFDPARIDFFIDKDPRKQGGEVLGRPVCAPEELGNAPRTILLNSIDFAPAIAADIQARYPDAGHRLVPIADLLS